MLSLADFHKYQNNAVTELYERSHLLAIIPTGGGKTAIGLTAFSELQDAGEIRQGLLVAPKLVAASVWPSEPAEWTHLSDLDVRYLEGGPDEREKMLNGGADLYTCGVNNIQWLERVTAKWKPDDPRLDILIVDEASKFKDPRGAWSKALRKMAPRFKTVWLMTGTPRPNSLQDYFVYMAVLTENEIWGRSFDRWRQQFFYPTDYHRHNWVPHGFATDIIHKDVARFSFRVPLSAVPRPPTDPVLHMVDLPECAMVRYKQMERDLFTEVNGEAVLAFSQAVSTGKLGQIAQGFVYDEDKISRPLHNKKDEKLLEILESAEGDPCAVSYWFEEDLERLKHLVPDLRVMGAETTEKEALELEEDWNAGRVPVMAIHPGSAGHGLNLQKIPCQLIHYSPIWSAELEDQLISRFARQGYAGDVLVNHYILAKNTVDEAKRLRVQGKLSDQQASLEYLKSVGV